MRLRGLLDCLRSVFLVGNFSFQVIDFFDVGSQVLYHIIGFTAQGPCVTDKNDRFIRGQRLNVFLQLIIGDINRIFEASCLIFFRATGVN